MLNEYLNDLSKEELIRLIEIYAKDQLALDGLWFQSIEQKSGMDEAMYHDTEAWKKYTVIEARRIKEFLGLDEHPGLEGLQKALCFRFTANLHKHEWTIEGNRLIFRNTECRVQTARLRKGMELHPCKDVGIYEYSGFASTIDDRIKCRCISCYPDCTESPTGCSWEFSLETQDATNRCANSNEY